MSDVAKNKKEWYNQKSVSYEKENINKEGGIIMVTKEMLIGEIVEKGEQYAEVLLNAGMHCLGCPASAGESLEEACEVHGIDVNEVMEALNALEA